MKYQRCINCTVRLDNFRIARLSVQDLSSEEQEIFNNWMPKFSVLPSKSLCQQCVKIIQTQVQSQVIEREFGHKFVCPGCGSSILRSRSARIPVEGIEHAIMLSWWPNCEIRQSERACRGCWRRASRAAQSETNLLVFCGSPVEEKYNPDVLSDFAEKSYNATEESHSATEESHSATEESHSATEESYNATEESHKATEESHNATEESHNVTEESHNTTEESHNATEESHYTTEESHNATEESHNATEESQNGTEESSNVKEKSEYADAGVQTTPPKPPPTSKPLLAQQILPPEQEIISLPSYKRAAATARRCIFPDCSNTSRLTISGEIKQRLLLDYKLYVPKMARICSKHLKSHEWLELHNQLTIKTFSSEQLEDIMSLLSSCVTQSLDFENIESMSPNLCQYWFGISSEQFNIIVKRTPSLQQRLRKPKQGLAIYLMKLRTSESNERLSTLFNIPRSTLERYMEIARVCLDSDVEPENSNENESS